MAGSEIPATIDPVAASLQSNLRSLLVLIGGLLAAHGVVGPNGTVTPERWEFIVGLLVTLAPFAYSWYERFRGAKNAKEREAIAVNAALNLVSKGAALAADGSLIPAPAIPLLPATPSTAADIIDIYGTRPSARGTSADDLNAGELTRVRG